MDTLTSIEAMQSITDRSREIVIRSEQDDAQHVRVTVMDCGVGFSTDSADRPFSTLFTTKSSGIGMGLSICLSIIELHGGRIWAVPDMPYGCEHPAHTAFSSGSGVSLNTAQSMCELPFFR